MPIDVGTLVAQPNFAPKEWQTRMPDIFNGRKPPVTDSAELRRVLALPRRAPPTPAQVSAMIAHETARYARPTARCRCAELGRKCITELRGVQAWTLYEASQIGGVFGMIAVGAGKTFLDILTAFAIPGCQRALLLVPPNLVEQLVGDYHLLSQHFRVPSFVVHGSPGQSWQVAGTPQVHVFPYSRLSRPESTDFIERLRPDLVIADEGDKLRNANSAGTSRVLRYFDAHPETRFCMWTGSATDKSLKDYCHLIALALKHGAPVPIGDKEVLAEWAEALDPGDWPKPAGKLMDGLIAQGFMHGGEHVRDGFRRRLHETWGVVHSQESPVSVELTLEERKVPFIPVEVSRALVDLRKTWCRPDGEELVDALSLAKCARELACGFYYRWRFPRGEPYTLILEWLAARKAWHQELRKQLKDRQEHLDSEMLCTNAAQRAWGDRPQPTRGPKLPEWRAHAWPEWRDVKDKVQPETEAVRLHPYLAEDAARWATEHRGIVWYESTDFGLWVSQISGLPMHGGGPDAGRIIGAERGQRSIIASLKSHGRGRNGLQFYFADQLVAQVPSSAAMWEQFLGRLHRPGQEAEIVRAWVYLHTAELRKAYAQALTRADYVKGTTGAAQKLHATPYDLLDAYDDEPAAE